ncbi:MAG: GGDEF domain-containing protein [Gammaproteobacteria bacterium]|nr:GGDEF domain-containing protein [Gammaproteobacteria bacterium]
MNKPRVIAWFILFLFCFNSYAVKSESFVTKMSEIDQIKSSDYPKFEQELFKLENEVKHMSSFEEDYLTLLKSYRAVYSAKTEEALQLLKLLDNSTVDPTIAFRAKALSINSFLLVRRYLDAFYYLELLQNQLPQIAQPLAREQGLLVLAMMYRYIERFDQAIEYTTQLEQEAPRTTAVCSAKQLKLDALLASNQHEKFLELYEQALPFCESKNELLFASLIRLHKAQYFFKVGEFVKALDLVDSTYESAKITKYQRLIQELDVLRATSYFNLNQNDKAVSYALRVLDDSSTSFDTLPKLTALKLVAEVAKTQKNYQQALDYHEQYLAAFTAYMDDKSAQQMAYHTAHSEILAQNQKIALLDKDNQLLQYEQTALKHQAAFNKLLIIALAVLVLGLAVMAYRSFVARQRFKALAEYDDLTAISNRYHFSASAKGALALCEKGQLPAALIVFDLDHFKQINDQFGHAAGDWALRQTVDTCRNFMRNNDVFGRIGGEEFAILLPGCQSDKAHLLADICRDAINSIDTAASGYEFKLSASFGVTSAEISGYHLTKLIEDADTAMYQAKQLGRNKVHFFQG